MPLTYAPHRLDLTWTQWATALTQLPHTEHDALSRLQQVLRDETVLPFLSVRSAFDALLTAMGKVLTGVAQAFRRRNAGSGGRNHHPQG